MLRTQLSEDIVRYSFDPQPNRHFATAIYALFDGNQALLIDTGYEFQAAELLEEFQKSNITISAVILSHFHDDHMQGLKTLPKVPVYGSASYQTSLDLWTEQEEHALFTPTICIDAPYLLRFGAHTLTLLPFPGHSPCTLLTKIDETYLHIADELMFSEQGEPLLPSTDPQCIKRHIDSLTRLRAHCGHTFLPGHGPAVMGSERLQREIGYRLAYMEAILHSGRRLTYEEAAKGCGCNFLHSEWHGGFYE